MATGNRDDALDIVQEAMMKLVRKYSRRPSDDWAPLFYRILQNQINDFHRRGSVKDRIIAFFRPARDAADGASPIDLVEDPNPIAPEQLIDSDRLMETLKAALVELPRRQQQVFLLRSWEGLSVRQTATAMSCSEGSVKTHYARAIRALRGKLNTAIGDFDEH